MTSCSTAAVNKVDDGEYRSIVPSEEQFALDIAGSLPGGVAQLSADGAGEVVAEISGHVAVFRVDGVDSATRTIVDRVEITDEEGSGPFKAKNEILILGNQPLVISGLTIDRPVIWPGSFEGSPVITVKPRNANERGADISCRADEPCLLLSAGVEPAGSYANANNPELHESPIASILIDDESINFALANGNQATASAAASSTTRACGLGENLVWNLPPDIGLAIDDPVLVHTPCPSITGAAIQLVVMSRSAVPILAPLTDAQEGGWCAPSLACLIFVPT